jgi:hypothetical protein
MHVQQAAGGHVLRAEGHEKRQLGVARVHLRVSPQQQRRQHDGVRALVRAEERHVQQRRRARGGGSLQLRTQHLKLHARVLQRRLVHGGGVVVHAGAARAAGAARGFLVGGGESLVTLLCVAQRGISLRVRCVRAKRRRHAHRHHRRRHSGAQAHGGHL